LTQASIDFPIHHLLEPEEEALALDMGDATHAAHEGPEGPAATLGHTHEAIHAEGGEEAGEDDDIELPVDTGAELVAEIPDEDIAEVEQEDGDGGADMGVAHGDEEVVEVGLVGMEGGDTSQDAHAHDTDGVEHGDGEDGQRQGHETHAPRLVEGAVGIGLQHIEHEDAHDDTHHEGAAITDKHLTGEAEDIVQEEGNQRGGTDAGEHDHGDITGDIEDDTEDEAGHDAVAAAVAVDTVDEVDGIDEAYNGDDGEGKGDLEVDEVVAPQAVEVVDAVVAGVHQHDGNGNLHQETEVGGDLDDVVDSADIQHHEHGEHDGEEVAAVEEEPADNQRHQDAEHDGDATQHGDGDALQLTGIGVVDDVFQQCYTQDLGEDPDRGQHGDHKGDEDVK